MKNKNVTLNNETHKVLAAVQRYPEIRASLFCRWNKNSYVSLKYSFNFIPSRALGFLRSAKLVKMSADKTYNITAAGKRMLARN